MSTVIPNGPHVRSERDKLGMTQAEFAKKVGYTEKTIWGIEHSLRCKRATIEDIAAAFGCDWEVLILEKPTSLSASEITALDTLAGHRIVLTELAHDYYDQRMRPALFSPTDDIPVLFPRALFPELPLDVVSLDHELSWDPLERESLIPSYRQKLSELTHVYNQNKRVFDGYIYRLLNAHGTRFSFCPGSYFPFLDTCEFLGFEIAHWASHNHKAKKLLACTDADQRRKELAETLRRDKAALPFRSGHDPLAFDELHTAFGTVTLVILKRSKTDDCFFINKRSEKLSETPELWHIIPAGTFQPNCIDDSLHAQEFSFKENVIREFVEEIFGDERLCGRVSGILDIDLMYGEDGRAFRHILADKCRHDLLYLGTVIDPLNLKPEILTVLLIHEEALKSITGVLPGSWESKAEDTEEGGDASHQLLKRVPFTKEDVARVMNDRDFVPTGKAHLWLALRHYEFVTERLRGL